MGNILLSVLRKSILIIIITNTRMILIELHKLVKTIQNQQITQVETI